jgi:hypothetical protein
LTSISRKYSRYDASIGEWTSILKLAHRWDFTEVKELARRGLDSLDIPAIQKIVLYQTYDVDRSHLQEAYIAVTVRDEPIKMDEGRELGLETVLRLAYTREIARAPSFSKKARSPVNLAGADLQVLISRAFQLPAAGAASGGTTQMPPSGSSTNAQDTTQAQNAQTNPGSSSSTPLPGRLIGASLSNTS